MDRYGMLQKLTQTGIAAVIRISEPAKLFSVVSAIHDGGIDCIEITMTTPNALDLIKQARNKFQDDVLVGVGSILDPETAGMAIHAGAQFVVSPVLNLDVIRIAHRYDRLCISGAFTPTEVLTAWEHGADVIKVFPASSVGPKFLKDIKGPLPQVKLTPTGGVNLDTVVDFLRAGAEFVGVGSALLNKQAIKDENWAQLTETARAFRELIQKYRETA